MSVQSKLHEPIVEVHEPIVDIATMHKSNLRSQRLTHATRVQLLCVCVLEGTILDHLFLMNSLIIVILFISLIIVILFI